MIMISSSRLCSVGLGLLAIFSLTFCGDKGEEQGTGPGNPLWISIDTAVVPATVTIDHVELQGSAYCDACPDGAVATGGCPPLQPPQISSLDIVWTNVTTGMTGRASHAIGGVCSCLFSTCWTDYNHYWRTTVPLVVGTNVIKVRVSDGAGNATSDIITITRELVKSLNGAQGIAVDPVNDEVFVASTGNSSIFVFTRTDNGAVTPKRIITGSATGLFHPIVVALDAINDELFVVNFNGTVTVYDRTASGDAAPARTLSVALTGKKYLSGIAVDAVNGNLFATVRDDFNHDSGSSYIIVYERTASGAAIPLRTISGTVTELYGPSHLAVDTDRNLLYVADVFDIKVFDRAASGDVAPASTIKSANQISLRVDAVNNELVTLDRVNQKITVFGMSPRTIAGPSTHLYWPIDIAVDATHDEIFVTNEDDYLTVYPRTGNGDVAPLRTVVSATGI